MKEKQELVRLLNLYQADLLKDDEKNRKEFAAHKGRSWEAEIVLGVKSQYKYARCIARKLSVQLGKEIFTVYG
jgi:hypothetical protein